MRITRRYYPATELLDGEQSIDTRGELENDTIIDVKWETNYIDGEVNHFAYVTYIEYDS